MVLTVSALADQAGPAGGPGPVDATPDDLKQLAERLDNVTAAIEDVGAMSSCTASPNPWT